MGCCRTEPVGQCIAPRSPDPHCCPSDLDPLAEDDQPKQETNGQQLEDSDKSSVIHNRVPTCNAKPAGDRCDSLYQVSCSDSASDLASDHCEQGCCDNATDIDERGIGGHPDTCKPTEICPTKAATGPDSQNEACGCCSNEACGCCSKDADIDNLDSCCEGDSRKMQTSTCKPTLVVSATGCDSGPSPDSTECEKSTCGGCVGTTAEKPTCTSTRPSNRSSDLSPKQQNNCCSAPLPEKSCQANINEGGCCSSNTADDCCNAADGDDQNVVSTCNQGCCGPDSEANCEDRCCASALPKVSQGDGCCSTTVENKGCCETGVDGQGDGALKNCAATASADVHSLAQAKQRGAALRQKEPMCPCCVQSMLTTNMKMLDVLLSRVAEAQSHFKRCCVAFAELCCAKSRTDDGCCELSCSDDDGCVTSVLPKDAYAPPIATLEVEKDGLRGDKEGIEASAASSMEDIVLEVVGMDCPDCLSKVTRAVKVLAGAEVTNADGVRGLVRVSYNPDQIDHKAIQVFAARASGFTINILDTSDSDGRKSLLLPLSFQVMPPAIALKSYQVTFSSKTSTSPIRKLLLARERRESVRAVRGEVDLLLPLDDPGQAKPRDVLRDLAAYGPTLRPHQDDRNHARINRDLRNISLRTLASLVLTIPILVLVWSTPPLLPATTSQSVQLGLGTLIVIVAWPVYSGSFRSAFYLHRADLGVLTSFSTLTSYIFSVIAFAFELAGRKIGEPFFETVGLLITLIFAGRTLQASTRKLGLSAVGNLRRLQPEVARLLDAHSQSETLTDVRLLHYDDVIRVDRGEVVPTDGVVLRGHATVDESSLTGESMPVPKHKGSTVTAGTTLTTGSVDIIVTHLVPENAISAIMDAVSSSSTGSDYQDLADWMAGWLLPIAGVCCLAAFIGWILYEHFRRDLGWGEAIISAVGYAIAIAAVSCPCALAIAVTLVTSVSMATTVHDGVLFRSVQALLTAHSVRAFAFDKTGTLSQGVMAVQQTFYDDDPMSLRLIHAITAASKHPVSGTAKQHLETDHPDVDLSAQSGDRVSLDQVEVVPGQGVSAVFFGFPLIAGNATFTQTNSHPLVREYLDKGMTILVITLGQQVIGLFGMKDQPRPGVQKLIQDLGEVGKTVSLVSGDNRSAVHAFAREVGIEPDSVHAGQSPASKATVVTTLKDSLPVGSKVAFVGDGINDTIALSIADVSIATGSASNATSDIILLSPDVPRALASILATSRLTRNHVIVSLTSCAIYFTVAILLASGVTGWRIPPAYAGWGELVSILPVLMVGASLALYKAIQRKLGGVKA